FAAEAAWVGTGHQRQRTAHAYRVTELPGFASEVFLRDQVFREVPALCITGKNQLEFGFALLFATVVPFQKIRNAVMAYYLEQRLVGAVDVFKFKIEHRVDPVFAQQRAEAVLKPEPGEQ